MTIVSTRNYCDRRVLDAWADTCVFSTTECADGCASRRRIGVERIRSSTWWGRNRAGSPLCSGRWAVTRGVHMANFYTCLRSRSLRHPDRRAFTFLAGGECEASVLSYEELDRRARAVAAFLQQQGASRERVLLPYHHGSDYVASFWGCLYAGAIAVPAYPPRANQSTDRLAAIARDSQASLALCAEGTLRRIRRRMTGATGNASPRWVDTGSIPHDLADEWVEPRDGAEAVAFLQYTSGSTAGAKGVMVTHANLFHNQRLVAGRVRPGREFGRCWLVAALP